MLRDTRPRALNEADAERGAEYGARPLAPRGIRAWTPWAFSLPLLAFIALPILAVLGRVEPAALIAGLRTDTAQQAMLLSLRTAAAATLLAVLLGTPLALLLARRRLPLGRLLDTLLDLPILLPPSVAGIALLMAFGRRGLFGGWLTALGVQLPFTEAAVVLAQLFVAAPLFVKAAALGFAGVDPEVQEAAAMDGANGWQRFWQVQTPLAWPALLSGAVTTWARALGEFGATIIFAGNFPGRTQTMPLAIYLGFEMNLDVALALSVVMIALAGAALIIVKLIGSRHAV